MQSLHIMSCVDWCIRHDVMRTQWDSRRSHYTCVAVIMWLHLYACIDWGTRSNVYIVRLETQSLQHDNNTRSLSLSRSLSLTNLLNHDIERGPDPRGAWVIQALLVCVELTNSRTHEFSHELIDSGHWRAARWKRQWQRHREWILGRCCTWVCANKADLVRNECVAVCGAVCCSGLPCRVVACSVLQCVAVSCSVLQCVALCCTVWCSVL